MVRVGRKGGIGRRGGMSFTADRWVCILQCSLSVACVPFLCDHEICVELLFMFSLCRCGFHGFFWFLSTFQKHGSRMFSCVNLHTLCRGGMVA